MKLITTLPASQKDVLPVVTFSHSPTENARLSKQARDILAHLKRGPVSNTQLAELSKKYSSRIADLRDVGYEIECYDQNHTTGVSWYRLLSAKPILHQYIVACEVRVPSMPKMLVKVKVEAANSDRAQVLAVSRAAQITAKGFIQVK